MLGIYRYALAMMVALSHLWSEFIWWQGIYGVFGFYVISGYLMTLILSEVYTGFGNSWRYALNRILRIFPVYWAALAITLIFGFSGLQTLIDVGNDIEAAYKPKSITELIGNFTLVAYWKSSLSIFQAWSIRVELVYYALMVFLCRDRRLVLIWLICSVFICAYHINENSPFYLRYSTVAGASIAFALGAAVYHLKKLLRLSTLHLYISSFVFFLHLIFASRIWNFIPDTQNFEIIFVPHHYGIYGNCLAAAYLIWAIASSTQNPSKSDKLEKIGKPLGDIAYAIFLTHWIAAMVVVNLGISGKNKLIFVPLTLIVLHIISFTLFKAVEAPINSRLRDRIRPARVNN